ncbi:MAG TPA: methyltransferase [Planctomycetota bacterium]
MFVSAIALVGLADPRPTYFAVGCVLVALAWGLRVWAFGHLEKNVVLVTTGPYAHTRNPAYLGSFAALVGIALAAGNPATLAGRLVWGVSLLLALAFLGYYMPRKLRREYPRLEALFGAQLAIQAREVPDFFPRLRPWRSGDDRRFSLRRVGENHEWAWGPVFALVMTAVWYAPRWSPLHGLLG